MNFTPLSQSMVRAARRSGGLFGRAGLYVIVLAALLLSLVPPSTLAQEPGVPELPVMVGMVEGTGTTFAITDSEYLNVTLDSSESVTVVFESVASMIVMNLEPVEGGAVSAQMILSGLPPAATYYMYEDSHENGGAVNVDATGSLTWTQDLTEPHHVWLQPNPSTKYIRNDVTGGDCTTIGAWHAGTLTCTLTTDVTETIEIRSDGLTLDGGGHTVQGTGSGYGVYAYYIDGLTIKNLNVVNFSVGTILERCSNVTWTGNTVSNNSVGVHFRYVTGITATDNDASNNTTEGFDLLFTDGGSFRDNTASSNNVGFRVWLSNGNTFEANTASNNGSGFFQWVAGDNIYTENFASNNDFGFRLSFSYGGSVLQRNVITNNGYGIFANHSPGGDPPANDVIYENIVSANTTGIFVGYNGTNKLIYNNSFVDNVTQVWMPHYDSTGIIFNLDAPIGGNYWSDWTLPNVDGDSFVDLPYVFEGGQDNLPWTTERGWSNQAPTADAGENTQITTADQVYTIFYGLATDPDGDALEYRWLEDLTVLLDWTPAGAGGEANLDLSLVPFMTIGHHTLTLEVRDAEHTASDTMVLTIDNSPPEVQPAPSSQVVEIGIDPIQVIADVTDFDGDTVSYQYLKNAEVLDSGSIATIEGGETVMLPDLLLQPGDPRFPLGEHVIAVRVDDGVNNLVSAFVSVNVIDTTAPSLSPMPDVTMLWPPNHRMVPVTIQANAYDNGGGAVELAVTVASSEPPDEDGDGNTIPDYVIDSVDGVTGVIALQLRSERSGKGEGRTYTVNITATDQSGNQSAAHVDVRAPHDRRRNR